MLHRKVKEGDRIILRSGEERIYLFFRDFRKGHIMVSMEKPDDWRFDHSHADRITEPLTEPEQNG